jgi:glycosyltransferase involved in cell wall biosynthesis
MTPPMFVSVVIATRNRSALLRQTLECVARQRWPHDRLEVVVADNGSTDDTRLVVEQSAARAGALSVRYLHVGKTGKSHAVNAALQLTRGDLVAFTDDDVQPDEEWICGLVRGIEETGADFVAGRILPIWETEPPPWMSPTLYGVLAIPDNGAARLPIVAERPGHVMPIGANMAVRAGVIARLGGLRTDLGKLAGSLRTGEDHEFFLRMLSSGCLGVYEPAALVRHWVSADRLRRTYFRQWHHQNGRDVARLERAYASAAPRLFGLPRYLWQNAFDDALAVIRSSLGADATQRFAATLRVWWFAGYLRESWFGRPGAAARAVEPAVSAKTAGSPLSPADATPALPGGMADPGRVSIIIATYNRAALLDECLDHLGRQRFRPGDEVIVVDNGSTDDTAAVVARHRSRYAVPLQLLNEPVPGKSRAIARALVGATGDVLAFTDDDVNADDGWLDAVRAAMSDPDVALMGGPVAPRWHPAVPPWIRRARERHARLGAPLALLDYGDRPVALGPRTVLGANLAVRRQPFTELGGFPPHLGKLRGTLLSGEDHELCRRVQAAGLRAMYFPGAVVHHFVPADRARVSYFLKWFFWSGITHAIMDGETAPAGGFTIAGLPLYLVRRSAISSLGVVAGLLTCRWTSALNCTIDVAFAAGYAAERWGVVAAAGRTTTAAGETV